MAKMNEQAVRALQETVWAFYGEHGRHDLPWRLQKVDGRIDPYYVMVSELMLQQTQVSRVIPKYELFLQTFPTVQALAEADLGDVLRAWQGLGYNRRAKFLWQAAQVIVHHLEGNVPRTIPELVALPGIGVNTAGAILAYAYDEPVIFIETNVRTVMIHHFFAQEEAVTDAAIKEAVAATLPTAESPRQWYWALMDYGSWLKRTHGNASVKSKTYKRQSTFQGSKRQIRGAVLKQLANGPLSRAELSERINDTRLEAVLQELTDEQLIRRIQNRYTL